ncbi:hypothetical protein ACRAWF_30645 [Streptomyces sp. L7]
MGAAQLQDDASASVAGVDPEAGFGSGVGTAPEAVHGDGSGAEGELLHGAGPAPAATFVQDGDPVSEAVQTPEGAFVVSPTPEAVAAAGPRPPRGGPGSR